MSEYRIEYSIQRATEPGGDFKEVGFGSSGTWDSIPDASHMMSSEIDTRSWETTDDMPDPATLEG